MIASKSNILFNLAVILLAVVFLCPAVFGAGSELILSQPADIDSQSLSQPARDLENPTLSFGKFVKYITNDITDTIEEHRLISLIHIGLFLRQRVSEPVRVSDKKTWFSRIDTPVIALFLGGHSPPAALSWGKVQS